MENRNQTLLAPFEKITMKILVYDIQNIQC